jgi:hypothetical protein
MQIHDPFSFELEQVTSNNGMKFFLTIDEV